MCHRCAIEMLDTRWFFVYGDLLIDLAIAGSINLKCRFLCLSVDMFILCVSSVTKSCVLHTSLFIDVCGVKDTMFICRYVCIMCIFCC